MARKTAEIKLGYGKVVVVDEEDYDLLSKFKWRLSNKGYASATISMHRLLAEAPKGKDVDHVNGDGLDNRKENLRICSRAQNVANTKKPTRKGGSSSKFKGVSWDKRVKKWSARVQPNGKSHRQYFDTEEEAARAYDEMAKEHFGEFARLNFP